MADYSALPQSDAVAPGFSIFGIPVIPATSGGSTNSDFPSLPQLPKLPDDIFKPGGNLPMPFSSPLTMAKNVGSAISETFSLLTNPERVVTVVVGVLFIFGGLYILGTSQIADAFKGVLKP